MSWQIVEWRFDEFERVKGLARKPMMLWCDLHSKCSEEKKV
jgi:hypothetical protein